jgi:hypothetical protein
MNWDDLFERAESFGGDLLVAPGCPPLIWSNCGLHVYGAPPFGDDHVCSMIDEIMPPPESRVQERGLIHFRIRRKQTGPEFCAAVFEYPSPSLALLTRFAPECSQPAS